MSRVAPWLAREQCCSGSTAGSLAHGRAARPPPEVTQLLAGGPGLLPCFTRRGAEVPSRSAALQRLLWGLAVRPSGPGAVSPREGGSRVVVLCPGRELHSLPRFCRYGQARGCPGCGSCRLITCCPGPAPRGRRAVPGPCAAPWAGPGRRAAGPAPGACAAGAAGTARTCRPSCRWPACSCP